jgi:hypothetical protein
MAYCHLAGSASLLSVVLIAMKRRTMAWGFLTGAALAVTFLLNLEWLNYVGVWTLYGPALVLALQWKGASSVVLATAVAFISLLLGLGSVPAEHLQRAHYDTMAGIVTISAFALLCLFIDGKRSLR